MIKDIMSALMEQGPLGVAFAIVIAGGGLGFIVWKQYAQYRQYNGFLEHIKTTFDEIKDQNESREETDAALIYYLKTATNGFSDVIGPDRSDNIVRNVLHLAEQRIRCWYHTNLIAEQNADPTQARAPFGKRLTTTIDALHLEYKTTLKPFKHAIGESLSVVIHKEDFDEIRDMLIKHQRDDIQFRETSDWLGHKISEMVNKATAEVRV